VLAAQLISFIVLLDLDCADLTGDGVLVVKGANDVGERLTSPLAAYWIAWPFVGIRKKPRWTHTDTTQNDTGGS
jgi:hypothetical protein